MKRSVLIALSLTALALLLVATGCDKEKIVESVEYVHETEYVQLPPDTVTITDTDTVVRVDTVYSSDSVVITHTDTLIVHDTIYQVENNTDTVFFYDTVHEYDTIVNLIYEVDTVMVTQCDPGRSSSFAALQYYLDPLVIDFINSEFGYDDGWVFYLSNWQSSVTQADANSWDLYGFIDYWTPDWSGYYALEYYYRVTYTGGDPEVATSWQLSEPPAAAPGDRQPGVHVVPKDSEAQRSLLN